MLRVTTRSSPARMICSSTVGGWEQVPSRSVAMMARAAFMSGGRVLHPRQASCRIRLPPERYRSGHNGTDSKSVEGITSLRGFESLPLRHFPQQVPGFDDAALRIEAMHVPECRSN